MVLLIFGMEIIKKDSAKSRRIRLRYHLVHSGNLHTIERIFLYVFSI